MRQPLLPSNTKIFRAARNVHRFFYFLNNRVYSFVTFEGGYNKQIAALFGALNALTAGSILFLGQTSLALDSNALPTGYQSASGNHQFNQSGNTLNVTTQNTASVVNYQSFNVGSNASVQFNLPSSSSRILNRVIGGNLSEIYGNISSNGNVFLINPSGVFFGNGANITVGGLVASTLNIADSDFLGGHYGFSRDAGSPLGRIDVAEGAKITASTGGASFISSGFGNAGSISAPSGAIQVAVGDRVTLGSDLVGFTIDEGLKETLDEAAIQNSGNMSAESVKMAARTIHEAAKTSIVNTGVVRATKAVTGEGGVIELVADSGTVQNEGALDASGTSGGEVLVEGDIARNKGTISAVGTTGEGGDIKVLGDKVSISNGSVTDASGATGGGNINIGGGFQGSDASIRNAEQTAVGETAVIKADAIDSGDGGEVVVWSDKATRFYGSISAKGGAASGNGGNVEVSGKESLEFEGTVDTSAANGQMGTLLLDPLDLTVIDGASGTTLTDVDQFSDTPGTNTNISVSTINASASNVTLRANRDLTFNNNGTDIVLTGTKSLTAQAGRDITVSNNVGISANGGITFDAARNISLGNNADLTTNNTAIILRAGQPVGPSAGGSGTISVGNNSDLVTNGGSVTMQAPNAISIGGNVTTAGGHLNISNNISGDVTTANTSDITLGGGSLAVNTVGAFDHGGDVVSSANINITADRLILRPPGGPSPSLNATGTVTLVPISPKAISVGGSDNAGTADTATSGGIFNVSQQELSRITANSVVIGDTFKAGGLQYDGTVAMSGFTGGGYNLTLNNAGLVTLNNSLNTNNHTLTVNSSGNAINLLGASAINTGSASSTFNGSTGVFGFVGHTLASNGVTMTANTGGISLPGTVTSTGAVNLSSTTSGGIFANGGGNISGTALTATSNDAIDITRADFTSANLTTTGDTINYTDRDGVTVTANTGSVSSGIVSITTGTGTGGNNGIAESGLILSSGLTQGNQVFLTANTGNISQTAGGRLQGVNLSTQTLAAGATQTLNDTDFSTATLTSNNGNITIRDRDGINSITPTTGTGVFSFTPFAPGVLSDNGILESTAVINGSGGTLDLTLPDGANLTVNGDYNRYYFNTSGTGAGTTVTATDTDGVFTKVNLGLGSYSLTTQTTGANTNGIVENDLVIEGTGITAASVTLLANAFGIQQSAGTVNVAGLLRATTTQANAAISLTDIDATTGIFNTNNGAITVFDADGLTATFNTGGGLGVDIVTNATGLTANNGVAESGLTLAGVNRAAAANLTARAGNILQAAGSTLALGAGLSATTTQAGATISLTDMDVVSANATTNAGNITLNDADRLNLTASTGGTTSGTVSVTTNAVGVLSTNSTVETPGLNLVGVNQAQTFNLTANSGNITQAAGSSLAGSAMNVYAFGAGGGITLSNMDAAGINAGANGGNITLNDFDGGQFNVSTLGGDASVTTFSSGATANNGQAETDLTLINTNVANTMTLTANSGNIFENVAGTTIAVNTLNSTTLGAGATQTFGNIDATNASFNSNGGNITVAEHDGLTFTANTGSASTGVVSVTTHAAAATSNNGVAESTLTLASGTTQAGTLNLTANAGNITQAAGSKLQANVLNATNIAASASQTLSNIDVNTGVFTTNLGDITVADRDGLTMTATTGSAASGTANITAFSAAASADNGNAEANLNITGNNFARTFNLITNGGNLQEVGTTLQGVNLTATNTALGGEITLPEADFTTVNLTTNQGNITYADRDGFNATFNTGSNSVGNVSLSSNVAAISSNNSVAEAALNLTGTNRGGSVTLNGGSGNITQSGRFTGSHLIVSTNGNLSLGEGASELDFATYTANSTGVGNSFNIFDTDNFQILGVNAPNTNFSITASKSGSAVNLNGNPLAPAVGEANMQVDGAILANNTNLLGRTGQILLNNNITANGTLDISTQAASGNITQASATTVQGVGAVQVLTSGNNADIITNAGSTLQSSGSSLLLRTSNTNADITTNGNASAATSATLRTSGSNGDIAVNAGLSSGAAGTTVQTTNTNAGITLGAASILNSTGATTVQTSGSSATINVVDGSSTTSTGLITVSTTGTNSGITLDGDMNSTANNVTVSTAGSFIFTSAPITQGVNSLIQGNAVGYNTTGLSGNITLNGDTLARTGDVTVGTTGTGADISVSGGLDATLGNTTLTTTNSLSDIQLLSGSTLDAGNNITLSATGFNGDITQAAGSVVTADNGNILISTGASNSDGDITLAGATDATIGGVMVSTAALNSNITLQGTSTVDAGTTIVITTNGINGDITQNAGSVLTADNGDVNITTTGVLNADADVSLAGQINATVGNIAVSTASLNSDILFQGTSSLRAGNNVLVPATGVNGDITQFAGSSIIADNGDVTISTGSTNADGDITLGGSIDATNGNVSVSTSGLNSNITLEGTSRVDAGNTVTFETSGINGDITQNAGSVVTADTGDVNIRTSGLLNADADISLAGTTNATLGSITVSTASVNSDILFQGTSVLHAGTDVTVPATGINGDITQFAGSSIIADNGNVTISTGALNPDGDITLGGSIDATNGNVTVSTASLNSSVTLQDTSTIDAGNTVTIETTGINGDITQNAGSVITADNGDVNIRTSGLLNNDADITLAGASNATAGNVNVTTASFDADITLQGTSSLQAGNNVTVSADGPDSDIIQNAGSTIVADNGNVEVSTGLLNIDGDITMGGSSSATVGDVTVSTASLNSDITLESTSSLQAGGNVTVEANGINGDITQANGSTMTADNGDVEISTGLLNVDGDITLAGATEATLGNVSVTTSSLNSDILLQSLSTIDAGNDVTITANGINGKITQQADSWVTADAGNVTVSSGLLNVDGDIDLAGRLEATNGAVSVSTSSLNADITFRSPSVLLAATDVDISTNGINGDITQETGSDITAETGNLTIATNGLLNVDADITLAGNSTATLGNVLVSTSAILSDVTLESGSRLYAGGTTTVATTGQNARIAQQVGSDVIADQDLSITTTGDQATINLAGSSSSQNGNTDITTTGADATVTLDTTGLVEAADDVTIETQGINSDVAINGDVYSYNDGDISVTTNTVDSDITQGAGSEIGRVGKGNTASVNILAAGSGNVSLAGTITAEDSVDVEVGGSTGTLALANTASLNADALAGRITLKSDKMAFATGNTLSANFVQFAAENANTTIGVAGGTGTLQLPQGAFDGITANEIMIGDQFTDTTISLGQLDLRAIPANITFNTLNEVQETTPTNDAGANRVNLFMASGFDAYFTGGAVDFNDRLTAPGIKKVGNADTIFGDIDIDLPGDSLAYVKLPDGVFSGKVIRVKTAMGEAYVNVPDDDDGRLRNLAGALAGRRSFRVRNEATPAMMLYMLGLASSPNTNLGGEGQSQPQLIPPPGAENSPATAFLLQAGQTPPPEGQAEVLEYGDSVNALPTGATGLPSNNTGASALSSF